MDTPTKDELLAFARSLAGQTLQTLHRERPFQVSADRDALLFMPEGNKTRRVSTSLDRFLKHAAETESLSPTDYRDITYSASYLLALLREWQQRRSR